ncbi:protein EPIDERMAL PATTERNING FACTOR 2-like [Cucurbita pepo subsp. pepo]|uniref:protein EPIDERMAL PATTERNING FACTOR 2-like n=1 Tax=Cucurbita pepo subsp. pepo TaxID=3664 RepID=UPI000C9D7331|nr:protein EPIDERMAL PATTERNING FACTOR 2-like [Cucurbita pepo subsp. pepo]
MWKFPLVAQTSLLFWIFFIILMIGRRLDASTRWDHMSFNVEDTHRPVGSSTHQEEKTEEALGMELYPTGSNLPDCSHACGPCFPCKRVMVSFKCSAAESCPTVYRCMCKGKYYHVPSN